MGKTCDVCGNELGFLKKFKYAESYICKECYGKASRQFTETIRSKSFAEIKALCSEERDEASFENFTVTGKIGSYMLIDDKHKRICITCNRLTSQKVSEPKFLDVKDIKKVYIGYQPRMDIHTLEQLVMEQRSEQTIDHLKVGIVLENGHQEEITLVQKPLRIKSYAFRQSFQFAKRINEEVEALINETRQANAEQAAKGEREYAEV